MESKKGQWPTWKWSFVLSLELESMPIFANLTPSKWGADSEAVRVCGDYFVLSEKIGVVISSAQ
jgi:hypothetical protein